MDADEKLTALKKAYADIILSISKEAAARVMGSERKSVRYQHELNAAKEEGLRMLLRLKKMMDSQITEAEAASLNQLKKIEELEAQLHEAEDIVSDLREELREVHAELDRVKNENLHQVNEPDNDRPIEMLVENKIYSHDQSSKLLPPKESFVASDVAYLNHRKECRKCYNKIACMCGAAHIENRDLPSIIMRGKEPGLYRNGCTQRIRACERNLLDRDLCRSDEADKVKDKKNGREEEESNDISKSFRFQPFIKKRKRAARQRKTVMPLGGKQSDLFLKSDHLPENSVKSDPVSVDQTAHSDDNTEASEKERNLVEISTSRTMHEDEGVDEKMVSLREVTGFSKSLCSPDCNGDVEKVDAVSHSLELSKDFSDQTMRGRVIKNTYQRKRKRQALCGSEVNGSLEMEEKMGNGQNGDQKLEEPDPSLLMESSRESRRLAQVARQLISLSEKKWWH